MRTVGVDLSASAERTAAAAVEWKAGRTRVGGPSLGLVDAELLDLLADAEWVGIDAPFGWPEAMVAAIGSYAASGRWPPTAKQDFRYRLTGCFAHTTCSPRPGRSSGRSAPPPTASPSPPGASPACARSPVRSHVRFDRTGADRVVEAYPAAALLLWGLDRAGYKASPEARERLLGALEAEAPWLTWEAGAREACVESDDALDAVLLRPDCPRRCARADGAGAGGRSQARAGGGLDPPAAQGSLGELAIDRRG